ncbi:MAG TPA: ABC transporter permease, partial [Clostridiales bacterium]|nr:ABC transporter permease [Clostridiales bacterium]
MPGLLAACLVGAALAAVGAGSVPLPAGEVVRILAHRLPWVGSGVACDWPASHEAIV